MSKVSEAAERLRRIRDGVSPWAVYDGHPERTIKTNEDNRVLATAYLTLIDDLKAYCNSSVNQATHQVVFNLLKKYGERHEADKH